MIEVDNIVKTYGDYLAVDHLSFKLEKGKIYGFLGPNGAGKSTTMNIMTGYIAADSGSVKINGHDILKEPEAAKSHIGYLPEIPPLYTDMTVGEYLRFVSELKKVPKKMIKDSLSHILEKTMLTDYENRMIRNLSKGYRQRVGLAQALVGDPEVIILDEPTVGLDPQQINQMEDLMRELKENHIVILSSHILSQVSEVCDYILIVSHGKLVQEGSQEELEANENKNQTLQLSLLSDNRDKIIDVLSSIGNVTVTVGENEDENGAYSASVVTDGYRDIRKEVGILLAQNSIPVLELSEKKITLEDIFLTATSETPGISEKARLKAEKKAKKEALKDMEETKGNKSDVADRDVPEDDISSESLENRTNDLLKEESSDIDDSRSGEEN